MASAASGMGLSASNLVGNLLFSAIGFVAFVSGKRLGDARKMVLGGALMGFSYLITDTFWMYLIGAGLTAALFRGGH